MDVLKVHCVPQVLSHGEKKKKERKMDEEKRERRVV